jgi:hypothetical protein
MTGGQHFANAAGRRGRVREFNTFGPVNPAEHYHVNRVAVKTDLRARIDKGRYLS